MFDWINKLEELKKNNRPAALAIITNSGGSTPRKAGAKMIILPTGEFFGTIGGGMLEKNVIAEAMEIIKTNSSKTISYPLDQEAGHRCGGSVEVFIESIGTNPHLVIFGGGHVGRALCKTMEDTPFNIHLIDQREEWIQRKDLSSSINLIHGTIDDIEGKIPWDSTNCYICIMTHTHEIDNYIIRKILHKPWKYLGVIGSKTKAKSFFKELLADSYPQELLEKMTSPIGLKTGGNSPKEIAISIAAQLLTVFYGKNEK